MKYIFSIIAMILIVSAATPAQPKDITILSSIKAGDTLKQRIEIPEGKTTIDVWADDSSKITCKFYDGSGNLGLVEENVPRCRGNANIVLPWHLSLQVNAIEHKDIDVRIWVRPTT